jgi:hypothetical protein
LLPRDDRHYGLIHAVARAQADAVAALDEAGFLALAQAAFGWRVGRFLACGARTAYPAIRVLAQRTIAERAVLIGNAAQTIHPIGAQGFNLGLRDALTLAELIELGCRANSHRPQDTFDCGEPAMLDAYARRRRGDREQTVAFSDGLLRLTSNPTSLLRPLRSLGLLATVLERSKRFQVVDPLAVSDLLASSSVRVEDVLARPERASRVATNLELAGWLVPILLERRGTTYLDVTWISAITGTALFSRRQALLPSGTAEDQRFPWEPRAED